MTSRLRRARAERTEAGFTLVWFAIVLTVLLVVAALGVDILAGYSAAQRAQNAADAAALAGVVKMPDFSSADPLARQVGADNLGAGTFTPEQTALPNQLKVTVETGIDTFFARVLGIDRLTIRRDAVAEYDEPVAMGSPANTFGNQPDCTGTCTNTPSAQNPQLWFNLAGTGSRKTRGDQFLSTRCTVENLQPDRCSGTNQDHDPTGYRYVVRNENGGGDLTVSIFDPAFVHVGDNCTDGALNNLYNALLISAYPDAQRYRPNGGGFESPYCTGDQFFADDGSSPYAPTTYYGIMRDPGTPWTEDDDEPVSGCPSVSSPRAFTGYRGDLTARWNQELANPALEDTVTQYFRKWVGLCTFPAGDGDYVLHMWTNGGSGHNRGSIRVAKNGSLASGDVSIFARGRMSIYQNKIGANTEFHLARVIPGANGRVLNLTFFDTGDAAQPGTLTVLPPVEARVGTSALTSFSGCRYTPPPAGPPYPPKVSTGAGCSVSGVISSGWNGQIIEWEVPIPDGYDCDYLDPQGCWLRIRFAYPAGVQDTTTWQARLGGNPVRLVE